MTLNLSFRLRDPHKCPANGSHFGQCDCEQEDYKLSGGSYFSKLRIDLTTMKIIGTFKHFGFERNISLSYAVWFQLCSVHSLESY